MEEYTINVVVVFAASVVLHLCYCTHTVTTDGGFVNFCSCQPAVAAVELVGGSSAAMVVEQHCKLEFVT